MPERVKTLAEIMRENPEAIAYNRSLREGMAAKRGLELEAPEKTCDHCGGTGFVRADLPVGHPLFGQLFPCPDPNCPVLEKRRAERYAKLCTLSQIPAEYQHLTFSLWDDLRQYPEVMAGKQDAYGAALAFVAAKDRGYRFTLDNAAEMAGLPRPEFDSPNRCSMVFSGANGVGKTSLAVCVARELIDAGVMVIYLRFAEFFDALKERFDADRTDYEFGGDAQTEAEVLRQYQQAPVLIIDEFYADATPWRKERAEQLVNYRYTHQLPTIVTTNLDADTLVSLWGMTTGHRLQAMAHWVLMSGVELRRRDGMVKSR